MYSSKQIRANFYMQYSLKWITKKFRGKNINDLEQHYVEKGIYNHWRAPEAVVLQWLLVYYMV